MKREIKFRGKRIDNGKWITNSETYIKDGDGLWLADENTDVVKVIPETVGQFAYCDLLIDKEVKDVYEGDVVAYQISRIKLDEDCQLLKGKQIAELFPEKFAYNVILWDSDNDKLCTEFMGLLYCDAEGNKRTHCGKIIEIIGNIHDNPELRKHVKDDFLKEI